MVAQRRRMPGSARALRTLFLVGSAVVLAAALSVCATNLLVIRRAASRAVSSPGDAPPATAAIVLGARVYPDGRPSPMLADRLDTAVDLYRAGKVRKVLLSGDHGTESYDEVNAMGRYVISRGVPAADVFMDHAGFSTYDTMYRARAVFRVTDALVVTQRFHLGRAVYTADRLGIDAVGVPADRRPYLRTRWNTVREWAARTKAVIQAELLHSQPRFLGKALPITADGRVTQD